MSSTESSLPYQGHITNICEEYAINVMRSNVDPTAIRPSSCPINPALKSRVGTVVNSLRLIWLLVIEDSDCGAFSRPYTHNVNNDVSLYQSSDSMASSSANTVYVYDQPET